MDIITHNSQTLSHTIIVVSQNNLSPSKINIFTPSVLRLIFSILLYINFETYFPCFLSEFGSISIQIFINHPSIHKRLKCRLHQILGQADYY